MSKTKKGKIANNDDIYIKSILTDKIYLNFNEVNKNILNILEMNLKSNNEGKCINEGYIKNNSIKIISYSTGELSSDKISFTVVYECLLTNPVESMEIMCTAKSITKVGIRAEINTDDKISPYIIFIARDHHFNNELFSQVKENDILKVKLLDKDMS